ncbi:MAG: superoxide dismutase family protein [Deinococcota bacterium]|jgi:Cu-Zn family superoxide dismutase|nr:superoxide dismutase family protein [Deinococcota bacterium]
MTKVLALIFSLIIACSTAIAQQEAQARAELQDADGNTVGHATFSSTEDGAVRIQVELEGLEAAAGGEHGVHLHETGECEPPDFESAGGHFNPTDAEHGLLNPGGPHAGDLPNIHVDEDGNASYEVTTLLISLDEGERSILDGDGAALVIHVDADDHITDPSGESGDRIACGVVIREGEAQADTQQGATQAQEEDTEGEEEAEPADQAQLAQQGEQVYAQSCAACHGRSGTGGRDYPRLAGNRDLADTQHVAHQIIHGGGGMPPFGHLSDEQIAAVATYIRTSWNNDFGPVSIEEVQAER